MDRFQPGDQLAVWSWRAGVKLIGVTATLVAIDADSAQPYRVLLHATHPRLSPVQHFTRDEVLGIAPRPRTLLDPEEQA